MNLFRSEEHARNWSGFDPGAEGGLLRLDHLRTLFGCAYFRERGRGDYISRLGERRGVLLATIKEVTGNHRFWRVP